MVWGRLINHVREFRCHMKESITSSPDLVLWIVFVGINLGRIWAVQALGVRWWHHMNNAMLTFIGSCTRTGVPIHLHLLRRDIGLLMRCIPWFTGIFTFFALATVGLCIGVLWVI